MTREGFGCIATLSTIALLALPAVAAEGGTNRVDVCGPIDADTTWTPANVYVLTCEVTVAKDVTLTVMPGTVVKALYGSYSPCPRPSGRRPSRPALAPPRPPAPLADSELGQLA